jgi:NodT family efflux transporter outer membrane factor (OMF) lipoprotein
MIRILTCVLLSSIVASCAVGPDFKRPASPDAGGYVAGSLPDKTTTAPGVGGSEQTFAPGAQIPAQWWTLFHSEDLNRLIELSLKNSPTLAAAQASLRQAQQNLIAERDSLLWPAATANAGATRQRLSPEVEGIPASIASQTLLTVYNASVNASYAPDVFGLARRQIEGVRAARDVQANELQATFLTLTANIVTTAVQEALLRGQLEATRDMVDADEKELTLTQRQLQIGAVARSVMLALETQVKQTLATIPPLELALAQSRHRLAVLCGKPPNSTDLPQFTLASFQLPAQLPISLSSELVHQRPDILVAEAQLHQASAAVGVATANMYPQLSITASYGFESLTTGTLFNNAAKVWSVGGSLLQPLFLGGQLAAQRRAAVAAYDSSAAQYRETVLQAFENVADTLRALELDAATLAAQADAESAARENLDLSTRQFEIGAISHLGLLDAQRSYALARISLIAAQAARFADTAALFQAMGGGWWNATTAAATPANAPRNE